MASFGWIGLRQAPEVCPCHRQMAPRRNDLGGSFSRCASLFELASKLASTNAIAGDQCLGRRDSLFAKFLEVTELDLLTSAVEQVRLATAVCRCRKPLRCHLVLGDIEAINEHTVSHHEAEFERRRFRRVLREAKLVQRDPFHRPRATDDRIQSKVDRLHQIRLPRRIGPIDHLEIDELQHQTRVYIENMCQLLPLFPMERGRDELMGRYETIVRASTKDWTRLGEQPRSQSMKPSGQIRTPLKQNGFRWARSEQAWQRQLNQAGRRAADWAIPQIQILQEKKKDTA